MKPTSKDFQNTTISSYDQTVNQYIQKVDDLHPLKESEKFITYLGNQKAILDIGCGPGRDAKIFSEKGLVVTGIDLSRNMIEAAIRRVKDASFKVMDMQKLEFEDRSFDGAWASACFLHIPKQDIASCLQEVHRVLKDQAVFYLSVKEGEGETLKADERYGGVEKFWSFFQQTEIQTELSQAGFEVIESYIQEQHNSYATNPWIHIFCRKKAL